MEKLAIGEGDYAVLAKLLRKVEFFAPLTIGQLEMVLPYIMLYRYDSGEKVFGKGEPGDALYLIYDGRVSIRVPKALILTREVATLGGGDFFGEMALLDRAPRSASVVTLEPSRLFVLLASDFDFILKRNPSFEAEVRKMAERRKFASEHGK